MVIVINAINTEWLKMYIGMIYVKWISLQNHSTYVLDEVYRSLLNKELFVTFSIEPTGHAPFYNHVREVPKT